MVNQGGVEIESGFDLPEPGEASEVIEGDLAVILAGPSPKTTPCFLGFSIEIAQIGNAAEFANQM